MPQTYQNDTPGQDELSYVFTLFSALWQAL